MAEAKVDPFGEKIPPRPGPWRGVVRNFGCLAIAGLAAFGGCVGIQVYQIASHCEREPLVSRWGDSEAARSSLEDKLAALRDGRGGVKLDEAELNAYLHKALEDREGRFARVRLLTEDRVEVQFTGVIRIPILGTYYANFSARGKVSISDGAIRVEAIEVLREPGKPPQRPTKERLEKLREEYAKLVLRGVRSLRAEGGMAILELDPSVGAGAPAKGEKTSAAEAPPAGPERPPTTGGGG